MESATPISLTTPKIELGTPETETEIKLDIPETETETEIEPKNEHLFSLAVLDNLATSPTDSFYRALGRPPDWGFETCALLPISETCALLPISETCALPPISETCALPPISVLLAKPKLRMIPGYLQLDASAFQTNYAPTVPWLPLPDTFATPIRLLSNVIGDISNLLEEHKISFKLLPAESRFDCTYSNSNFQIRVYTPRDSSKIDVPKQYIVEGQCLEHNILSFSAIFLELKQKLQINSSI